MTGIGQPGRAIQSASIELIRNVCHAHGLLPLDFRWDNDSWVELPFMVVEATQPVIVLTRPLDEAGELGNAEIRTQLGLKDRTLVRKRYILPRC
jgi:hypothetical protein